MNKLSEAPAGMEKVIEYTFKAGYCMGLTVASNILADKADREMAEAIIGVQSNYGNQNKRN